MGWTPDVIRKLTPSELWAILNELNRQVALDQYNTQRNHWAFLAAVITNCFASVMGMFSKRKPKMIGPDDYMNKDAKKMLQRLLKQGSSGDLDYSKHIEDARAKGLAGPW